MNSTPYSVWLDGIEKWTEAVDIPEDDQQKIEYWWRHYGRNKCSFCHHYAHRTCGACPLRDGKKCDPNWVHLNRTFITNRKVFYSTFHEHALKLLNTIYKLPHKGPTST